MENETTAPPIGHNTKPDPDAEAVRARQAFAAYKTGAGTCFAAILDYGRALRVVRDYYKSDKLFGKWVKDNRLDQEPFNRQQERNAAIQIAEILPTVDTVGSFSDCPYSTPTNIMKWWNKKNGIKSSPKSKAAKTATDAATGEPAVKLTERQKRHIEAQIKARKKELGKDFADRVRVEVEAQCQARFPELEKVELRWRQMFTSQEYRAVKLCCTPDGEPSQEDRETAFNTLLTLEQHFHIVPKKSRKRKEAQKTKAE